MEKKPSKRALKSFDKAIMKRKYGRRQGAKAYRKNKKQKKPSNNKKKKK